MTKLECAAILAYLEAGCGKPLPEKSAEVYCDLLIDLPREALATAAQRVLLQHPWATFPSIAELRQAAVETIQRDVAPMSGEEAWKIAWRAAGKIDLEISGSLDRHIANVPPLVAEAMRAFGLPALCCAEPNFARPQFIQIFDVLAAREKRMALFPEKVLIAITGEVKGKEISEAIQLIGRIS